MSPNVKKALIAGVVVVVLFFLISNPTGSADAVHMVLGWFGDGAEALMTFVRELFNG